MGIFDYFLSHAKQEQDKAIRDKIKNRRFFSRMLIEITKSKGEAGRLILEASTNKRLDTVYLHWSLGERCISGTETRYPMDANMAELKRIYSNSLEYFATGLATEDPIYFEILERASSNILLDIFCAEFQQFIDYMGRVDSQAKSADWAPDLLLWFMLNSRVGEDKKRTHVNKLAFPKLYKGLFKLTQLSDAQAAKKALIDYIKKWYNLNRDAPQYNNYLKASCYRGYWVWEVAAVAKILQIGDSNLRDNPCYPYDMVHWEEDDTTSDKQ